MLTVLADALLALEVAGVAAIVGTTALLVHRTLAETRELELEDDEAAKAALVRRAAARRAQ